MVHPPPCHWHGGGWTRHHNIGSVQNTVTYGYDTGSWGDLLISFNGQSIAYDGIGNPGTWNGSALTWQGRRLMSYGSNTYTYNADGIRTSKTVNGVEHIYHLSGTQILSEEWTEGNVQHILIFVYDASGQPIGMSHYENGEQRGTYVFVKNIQGDVIGIYDEEGTCLVTYTYDAWGNVTVSYSNGGASTAARYNPFRYRGYYYDTETSLYYLNSRYYDPNVGRFLNADGSVNANGDLIGFNMFAYCSNNPVMWCDFTGDSPTSSWGVILIPFKTFFSLGQFARDLFTDAHAFDLNNESEKKVLESNYFSAYKGKMVFRIDGGRSGSFGALFITRKTNTMTDSEDTVRHEYGHTQQLKELGALRYLIYIGIPSALDLGSGNYYDKPWEVTADVYGGVQTRIHEQMYIEDGFRYLETVGRIPMIAKSYMRIWRFTHEK